MLQRIFVKNREGKQPIICSFCEIEVDTAEHTLQTYERWSVERNTLREKIGPDLNLSVLIGKVCEDEDIWKAFLQFAETVMHTKEEEERLREYRRRNDGEGEQCNGGGRRRRKRLTYLPM